MSSTIPLFSENALDSIPQATAQQHTDARPAGRDLRRGPVMTADDVTLTEAERQALYRVLSSRGDSVRYVERILTDRLAAVQAEVERSRRFGRDRDQEAGIWQHRAESAERRLAEVEGDLAMPLFDAVTKAASPDDWARHLPNCGYSDDGPVCGCADFGGRLMAAIKATIRAALANPPAEGGQP